MDQIEALKDYLPPFIWEYRENVLLRGHAARDRQLLRDYSPALASTASATAALAGEPKLTEDGGLVDYTAGLPFPPDRIEPDRPARRD